MYRSEFAARRTRIRTVRAAGLLVVIAAIAALGYRLLASSSSTGAPSVDAVRSEHRGARGAALPGAQEMEATCDKCATYHAEWYVFLRVVGEWCVKINSLKLTNPLILYERGLTAVDMLVSPLDISGSICEER